MTITTQSHRACTSRFPRTFAGPSRAIHHRSAGWKASKLPPPLSFLRSPTPSCTTTVEIVRQDSDAGGEGDGESMMSPVLHADDTATPLRGATTPLPDLSLPPPPRATATPGSTASSRAGGGGGGGGGGGAGSLVAYRNSLGSVSERNEREGGRAREGGDGGAPEEDDGSEEADAFAGEGTLWDPAAFGDDG